MDGYYNLTFDLWSSLNIDPEEFFQDDWEDDGDGGFWIPMSYDENGNGTPDFLDSLVGNGGTGTTIPGSGGFVIG